jgi:hypothetical protein
MASEDSDQILPGLLAIHRLSDLGDVRQTPMGPMGTGRDHLDAADELLKVLLLRRMHRMRNEERNDRLDQIRTPPHNVAIQVFRVVVVSPIGDHASHAEEVHKLIEAGHALSALRNDKLVSHLVAGLVAFPARATWLSNEADGEATLSVYKTNNPANPDQSFLLISCTRHILTVPPTWDGTRSAGYSGVPAYGQMRTARLPVRGAAIILP